MRNRSGAPIPRTSRVVDHFVGECKEVLQGDEPKVKGWELICAIRKKPKDFANRLLKAVAKVGGTVRGAMPGNWPKDKTSSKPADEVIPAEWKREVWAAVRAADERAGTTHPLVEGELSAREILMEEFEDIADLMAEGFEGEVEQGEVDEDWAAEGFFDMMEDLA